MASPTENTQKIGLPPQPRKDEYKWTVWNYYCFDLYLLSDYTFRNIYAMIIGNASGKTTIQLHKEADVLFSSIYGQEYLIERKYQIESYFRTEAEKRIRQEEAKNRADGKESSGEQRKDTASTDLGNVLNSEDFNINDFSGRVLRIFDKLIRQMENRNDEDFDKEDVALFKAAYSFVANNIEERKIVPPVRVLAEQCRSCRYRLFCEDNVEDECSMCNFRKIAARVLGRVMFDHKTMLKEGGDAVELSIDGGAATVGEVVGDVLGVEDGDNIPSIEQDLGGQGYDLDEQGYGDIGSQGI